MRTFLLLLIAVPVALAVAPPGDDAAKKDLAKFQGTWQAVSVINMDGKPAPADDLKETHLLVVGNTFTLRVKDATIRGTFMIDPKRDPKTIDVMLDGAKPKDKIVGIYRIDGDLRKSCFAFGGKARPKDFPTDGKEYLQFVWKPAAK